MMNKRARHVRTLEHLHLNDADEVSCIGMYLHMYPQRCMEASIAVVQLCKSWFKLKNFGFSASIGTIMRKILVCIVVNQYQRELYVMAVAYLHSFHVQLIRVAAGLRHVSCNAF